MSPKHGKALFLLAFVLSVCRFTAAQGCWSYYDPQEGTCSGPGGCEGYYPRTECTTGCIAGSCNPDGNSTECCGVRYDYAQGYSGYGECDGYDCGNIRRARRERTAPAKTVALNIKPDIALLTYRSPRIVFVPNRCTHEYEAFFENLAALPKGGM